MSAAREVEARSARRGANAERPTRNGAQAGGDGRGGMSAAREMEVA